MQGGPINKSLYQLIKQIILQSVS